MAMPAMTPGGCSPGKSSEDEEEKESTATAK